MNTNTESLAKENCPWCSKGSNQKLYCPYCGRSTGRISEPLLSLSPFDPPVNKVEILDGQTFSIRFKHISGVVVNIECDITNADNIAFQDENLTGVKAQVQSSEKLDGYFEFRLKNYRVQPSGYLIFRFDNAERDLDKIWKKKNIKEIKFSINDKIHTASSEWIPGSEFLFFSNKLTKQSICIYNPSTIERKFEFTSPNGYNIYPQSEKYSRMSYIPIKGKSSEIFYIDKEKQRSEDNPTKWKVGNNEVELFELPIKEKKDIQKSKLKISFDLGARKISIRALWRGFALLDKKIGEIDEIGGSSFPPTMLLDVAEKEKYFFEEAEYIKNKRTNLIEIIALKTCLRDFKDRYVNYNKNWTNEYLLSLLFSKITEKIKQWISELFKSKDKSAPINFNEYFNKPEYIFSYPILETEEKTKEYKNILKSAFINSFDERIEDSQIKFIPEPEAVLNYITSKKKNIKLNEGELFAVIDSGAGTTDLSVGKIKRKDGNFYLADIKSVTLDLNENQKKNYELPQNQNAIHIGGVLIDRILSYILETNARAILDSPNGRDYINYWNARAEKDFSKNEKINISKRIKERISENKEAKLQVNNLNFDISDKPSINNSNYGDKIIEPILKKPLFEANEKFISLGINFKNIATIILIGGSNICQYMRYYTIKNLPLYTNLVKKDDEQLTKEDRLNAVVEGLILETENMSKKSFATFTIKDKYNEINEVIIKEKDVISPISIQRSIPFDDSDTVILELFAESELWNGSKKIASAMCKKSNSISEDYGDEVIFEINVSNQNCVCNIYYGEYSGIGWNIQIT